ncbi:hypothetical protein H7J88_10730 [Mycolicibacterium flavescens]|uniref:Uncharacterized protein n=1 Tax=Mycolicibacterium flavescens TaxID=1776 RepID=A0A1E3RCJ5_MYCFV|nr:hypothetical protein [Mycolicibacterium flavescens]MCV7280122.1 hypothetical protein [Mycolicibacterium flavescens]ODQ87616.1 hypothetical protein BHQ18_22635 [Mycolicibacterium flavescens]
MSDQVTVIIDRASVAMGDDVDSHLEFWSFPATATVDDLLVEVSTHYLPGVAGPAGWRLYMHMDDPGARQVLGLIYTRDDLRVDDQICRLVEGHQTLGELARFSELEVYASYLVRDQARPISLSEAKAGASFTGCRPTRLESEAQAQAEHAWSMIRELDREAAGVQAARRDWIRTNIVAGAEFPSGADVFVARNFPVLANLLCNASMNIAGELLGIENPRAGIDLPDEQARTATLVMMLAGFEWGLQQESWRFGEREYCRAYLEFLAGCGYALTPIEHVMAGHVTVEEFLRDQDAVRERVTRIGHLREQQHEVWMNHYHGKISHEQYEAATQPINAELTALGQHPGPPMGCCR